jgi:transposase-like protein
MPIGYVAVALSLGRVVAQDDDILDILVQRRRNTQAAKKCFRKLLKGLLYVPRVIITDTCKSYGAAKRASLPGVEHRQSRSLNNRCERASADTSARASHAGVAVSGSCPALARGVRPYHPTRSTTTASVVCV